MHVSVCVCVCRAPRSLVPSEDSLLFPEALPAGWRGGARSGGPFGHCVMVKSSHAPDMQDGDASHGDAFLLSPLFRLLVGKPLQQLQPRTFAGLPHGFYRQIQRLHIQDATFVTDFCLPPDLKGLRRERCTLLLFRHVLAINKL